jgi:GTP-dependent phosphoenolpyruvate carboxykinase
MRVLLKASMDTERSNEAIRNGTLPKMIQEAVEHLKPEAAYFTTDHGKRTAFLVFDMQESSQMPATGEPFFLNLGAEISYTPVMNLDDVQKGLSQLDL